MAGDSFTWLPKFSEAIAAIPDEGQALALTRALVDYGVWGIEPQLEYPLNILFNAFCEDIDNGKEYRASRSSAGRKSGEARRSRKEAPKKDTPCTPPPAPEPAAGSVQASAEPAPNAVQTESGAVRTNTIPSHTIPSHAKEGKGSGKPDPRAAEVAEVIGYLNERKASGGKGSGGFRADLPSSAKPVRARLEDGFTVADCKLAIDGAIAAFDRETSDGEDMRRYIRPKTIFAPSNFEGYLDGGRELSAKQRGQPRVSLVTGRPVGGVSYGVGGGS